MDYRVEHNCPQCDAPIEFSDKDRFLKCPFCGVKSFLAADEYHFVMPSQREGELVFAPYLRLQGMEYLCDRVKVVDRLVDCTRSGVPMKELPLSLGVRPQALKLMFARGKQGRFLRNFLSTSDALELTQSRMGKIRPEEVIHRAYIGETFSRIYLPLQIRKGQLFDAVSGGLIGNLPGDRDIFEPVYETSYNWQPEFIATICPECGWDLDGESDAIALCCKNCQTIWEKEGGRFSQIDFHIMASGKKDSLYLPFWKMEPEFSGIDLNSYGAFLKITNQPRVILPEWHNKELSFWTPAFKIRPKTYLRLSKQLTVLQKEVASEQTLDYTLYPVTLPAGEAAESIKIILVKAACNTKDIMPKLPNISCRVRKFTLVYLPFSKGPQDLIQEELKININKRILTYGRYLS